MDVLVVPSCALLDEARRMAENTAVKIGEICMVVCACDSFWSQRKRILKSGR